MLEAAPLVAKLRFFSGDPIRAEQYCISNGVEPDIPGCLAKMEAILQNDCGRSRVESLLQALIDTQPTELGKLTAAQWLVLRDSAWGVAGGYASKEGLGSGGGWVHHLPGGGDFKANYKHNNNGTKAIRDGVRHPITGVPLKIPDHLWRCEPAWKYPPLRSLVQRSAEGRDLSRFFHHLFLDAQKRSLGRVSLDLCYPAGSFKHDYLWFNVVALGEAIIRLADGFAGEAIKAQKQGRVMWSIRELDGDSDTGIELVLRQFFQLDFPETQESNAGIVDSGSLGGSACGVFVPVDSSVKSIKEAYEHSRNAGAEITGIEGEGGQRNWRIFVKASCESGVWKQSSQEEQL